MRKNIALICVGLAAALAAQGCFDTNIDMSGRSFKDLCEISGGEVDQNNPMQCRCGNEDEKLPCLAGVVCISIDKKLECANGSLIGTPCNDSHIETVCETIDGKGNQLKCVEQEDGSKIWEAGENCTNNADCTFNDDGSSTCGICQNNTQKCNKTETGIMECANGQWKALHECNHNICIEIKDENNIISPECVECNPTKTTNQKCENNALYTCSDAGKWINPIECTNKDSNTITSCKLDNKCGVCFNGEFKCHDGILSTCINGEWKNERKCKGNNDNNISCSSSTSCGECKDNDEKCYNDMHFVCIDGNWIMDKICEFGCSDDNQLASCNECANDAKKCENGISKICQEGKWNDGGEHCNCVENEVACRNIGDNIFAHQICVNNDWTTLQICQSKCEGVFCAECDNGDVRCENGMIYECNNGNWDVSHCEYRVCMDDMSCGVCFGGDSICENGMIKTCINGVWKEPESCGENKSCKNSKECGDCLDGEVECLNNVWRKCTAGVWSDFITCPGNYDCRNDGKTCGDCASSMADSCTDSHTAAKCIEGEWKTIEACGDDKYCFEGSCIESQCNVYNYKTNCQNSTSNKGAMYSCELGIIKVSPCVVASEPLSCDSNGTECGDCLNNSTYYQNVLVDDKKKCEKTECVDGKKIPTVNKDYSCLCPDGVCVDVGECLDGETSYKNDENSYCIEFVCKNGKNEVIKLHEVSCKSKGNGTFELGNCYNGKKSEYKENPQGVCEYRVCNNGEFGPHIKNENEYSCVKADGIITGVGTCNNNDAPTYANNTNGYCVKISCDNGKPVETISNSVSCNADKTDFGECLNGFKQYANNSVGYCVETSCENGLLKHKINDEVSCNADNTGFGECLNNAKQYANNSAGYCVETTCKNGESVDYINTSFSCNADKTGFGECLNGMFEVTPTLEAQLPHTPCNLNNARLCKNGNWLDPTYYNCSNGCEKVNENYMKCK